MLEQLLQILTQEGITTLKELAERLGISVGLLKQMLQNLAQGGYIEQVDMVCDGHCAGCEQSSICALMQGQRLWRVTEKGFRLAARREPFIGTP